MDKERAMIFVDHANVYMNLIKLNCLIDYVKFKNVLAEYSHLVGAFMFMGLPKKIPKELKKFITYLKKAGYIIQPKPLQISPNGKKRQKGIDVFMYKEILELAEADAYDKAIILNFVEIAEKKMDITEIFAKNVDLNINKFTPLGINVKSFKIFTKENSKENVKNVTLA